MMYDRFQSNVDMLQREIASLKKASKFFEADLKKLELIYEKINYYQEAVDASVEGGRMPNKSFQDSLDCALREIGRWRDYLYEEYNYEET